MLKVKTGLRAPAPIVRRPAEFVPVNGVCIRGGLACTGGFVDKSSGLCATCHARWSR